MSRYERVYIQNCINTRVDEFITEIAESYNCDWDCSISKYLDLVTDRVNKQLKQLRKELNDNYND